MPSVQSSNFNYTPFLEPTALVSLALLAGFTRVIEYLPGASRGGILLSGGLATTGSLLYTHARLDPKRSYARTLLEKTAVLALANISALLLAKPLQGRLSLSAAGKLGCIQFTFTAAATKWNAAVETPLQKKHRHYNTHQKEWRTLSVEDRTKLAKQFYDAGLSGICLFEAPINVKMLNPLFAEYFKIDPPEPRGDRKEHKKPEREEEDFLFQTSSPKPPLPTQAFETHLDTLSSYQLSWLREILQSDINLLENLPPKVLFSLMQRFHDQGIESLRFNIANHADFLRENSAYLDLLHKEFQKEPIYSLVFPKLAGLFKEKPPLPTLEETIKTLSTKKIQAMDPILISMWHHVLKDSSASWKALDSSLQSAFMRRFVEYKDFVKYRASFHVDFSLDIQWVKNLSEKEIEELSSHQKEWLHNILKAPKLAQELSFKTTYALNKYPGFNLPYKLTHEVVVAAQNDPDLVRALHQQTWRQPVEETGQEGPSQPYFHLTGLSPEDQRTLEELLNNPSVNNHAQWF